jgi:hypothetical protein
MAAISKSGSIFNFRGASVTIIGGGPETSLLSSYTLKGPDFITQMTELLTIYALNIILSLNPSTNRTRRF